MRNKTLHSHKQPEKYVLGKFKSAILAFALLWGGQNTFAQSVGVNTNNPDPSASLEVAGINKGLLIPRISLTSLTDKTTIPNPATALLIYNTNAGLGKAGFYYNSGTAGNPVWANVSQSLTFPFSNSNNIAGTAFYLENGALSTNAIGILSSSNYGIGLEGATAYGQGVLGYTFQDGVGVQAEAQNTTGTALKVIGKMNIAGPGQSPGAGKVLTSDVNGNATWQNPVGVGNDIVAFSASGIKGGGSEVLANNTVSKVPFANQLYDLGNDYIDVNGVPHSTFMAPFDGIYHFEAAVEVVGSSVGGNAYNNELSLVRTRNNQTQILVKNGDGGIGSTRVYLSRDVQLQTGDRVHVNLGISAVSFNGSLLLQPEISYFSGRLVVKQ